MNISLAYAYQLRVLSPHLWLAACDLLPNAAKKTPQKNECNREGSEDVGERHESSSQSKWHMMDGYLLMDLKIIKLGSGQTICHAHYLFLSLTHNAKI